MTAPRHSFDLTRFGVGQPVPRSEDPKLLRGQGRFSDDVNYDGQVYMAVVRSPFAHGRIRAIATEAAAAMEGVLGVWTGTDLERAGYKMGDSLVKWQNQDGTPYAQPTRLVLPVDKVRFAGEPVAFVVAKTADIAKDAAEAVTLDIEPLPAVIDAAEAVKPGAPQLHDSVPGNVCLDYHFGDAQATDAAFARAKHVGRLSLLDSRIVINPMELRAYLAIHDRKNDHFILHTSSQGVFALRSEIAGSLGVPVEKLRILTDQVGGSFGMRAIAFPEQICALHAARELERPVKWTEERTPSFLSDYHGRANNYDAALAIDEAGNFLAVRIEGFGDLGAYLSLFGMVMPTMSIVNNTGGQYRLPLIEVSVKCALTNKSPVGAYRGAGRQCGNYIMERLIDETAAVSGIDRVKLRRINQLKPSELPHKAPSGMAVDVGDFKALMDDALKAADVNGFKARRKDSLKKGKLRGLGIGCYLEVTGGAPKEQGRIRFEENGDVTFVTGTLDYGQGHTTTFAQILGQKLGIAFDRIKLVQGDSDQIVFGGGTSGSRSVIASGTAAIEAADKVIEKAMSLAGWALKTNSNDVEFRDGRIVVAGTGVGIDLPELAQRLRNADNLPAGLPNSLDVELVTDTFRSTFPNGCHVCEVEIDEATGVVEVVNYTMVNDIGTVINPLLADGQSHGGVVQGIGQALYEEVVYDSEGQLLTGSFTDYCLPRATDVPQLHSTNRPVPTGLNALGVKGVGESGCAGSITSVMNAVADALSAVGVRHIDMPATPQKVWRTIQEARRAKA